ncbi:MAG: glycosyltransferase family 9 protein [Epsilonproteobacteria bacterium]|nr:glycosyltransferase family 9 protein [Campylobacterota bacterium]
MKLLIELPTWLGDTVMTTPAIENLIQHYPDSQITLFGSFVSIEALKNHPNITHTIIDESKKANNRFIWLYKQAKALDKFDLTLTFRRTLPSKFFHFFLQAKKKGYYKRYTKTQIHQAIRYNDFINQILNTTYQTDHLKLYYQPKIYQKPTLGINPGATYGSAKRWYPERFAEVAIALHKQYNIVIFGGPSETDMAADIEEVLQQQSITNYQNLAGKTSISELIEHIAGLTLFITGDSGPMHIASAYQIPTVSLFGPTKHIETSQWMNKQSSLIRHQIACSPCMKRECPLKTHECMKLITAKGVIEAAQQLLR